MAKLSEKHIAVTITGGYIHIILPDTGSETGFTSYRLKLEDYLTGGGAWGTITGTLSDQTDLNLVIQAIEQDITDLDSGKQDALGFTPENAANKVTSFQVTPTNTAYPSEKLVKDTLDNTIYSIGIALAQLDTDIELKTGVAAFPFPENATLIEVFIRVSTAPTGSNAIWDVNTSGSSILTNKITIEASEFSSLDATTQPSFSDSTIDKGEAITVDCDQPGVTIAGQNPVLIINYKKR